MDMADALIVSHGQPSAPLPAEAALAAFADSVSVHLAGLKLASATMAAPGTLEQALTRLKPNAPIYPFFMSDGWFVRTNLSGRLGEHATQMMEPFGLDSALPEYVAKGLQLAGLEKGAPLLMVAHGSGSGRPAPARASYDFAARLEANLPGTKPEVAFLEQAPSIADVMQTLPKDVACLPFFAMEGDHVRKDVHEELSALGYTGRVTPVISHLPGVDAMVAKAIHKNICQA